MSRSGQYIQQRLLLTYPEVQANRTAQKLFIKREAILHGEECSQEKEVVALTFFSILDATFSVLYVVTNKQETSLKKKKPKNYQLLRVLGVTGI